MTKKDVIVAFRMNADIKEQIDKICEEKDIPISQWIREAVRNELKKENAND